jgi:cell wall-associated NlpC family hydrolase
MTVELTGFTAAQARIAQIQAHVDGLLGSPVRQGQTVNATTSFESALATATRSTTTTAGASRADSALAAWSAPGLADPSQAGGAAAGVDAADVISAARKYLGVPYKWGGVNPAVGLDCSGFVQRAFADVGIKLPRVSGDQAKVGTAVRSLAEARPGDLVAFGRPVDHIGIYLGNNTMIVAPHTGDVVKVQKLYRTPTEIRRILPESNVSVLGAARAAGGAAVTGSALAKAPAALQALFQQAQLKTGVPASLLAAVAWAESGFNPSATSSAGAKGLMQLMPATARELGVNPRDPAQAVDGAARLLRKNLTTFGSTELALAAYNAGAGAVRRYGGIPPYAETQGYVRKIMADPGVKAL